MDRPDVVIAGAGPAGSVAAAVLAANLLFEMLCVLSVRKKVSP